MLTVIFLLLVLFDPVLTATDDDLPRRLPLRHGEYDEYMLTRIYPAAVCRADDDAVPDSCVIPSETISWSIHGLWPERTNVSYPQFCDGIPMKFDPEQIMDIRHELMNEWPNLFPKQEPTRFWKHEYEKHGTCAQKDATFKTEKLYFSSTMDLHKKYNVEEALKKGGITWRQQPYEAEDIQHVLNTFLGNGHYVQMHCLTDSVTKQSLLADTRLCLSRDTKTPVDCSREKNYPVVEIQGEALPLPTFRPCEGKVTLISPYSSVANQASYDEYMLTQIYPTAVCRADDDSVPDSCEIPNGTPEWSIHGLWPERSDGSWPSFCDANPKRFDPSQIKRIEDGLKLLWPNLYPSKSAEDFWKHEYEKHGTCAQQDPRFGTELKYFNGTVDLYKQFDVHQALKAGNIVPRERPYRAEEIQAALNEHLGQGQYVQINCLTDRKTRQTMLGDVRLCLNLKYEPVACPKGALTIAKVGDYPLPTFRPCRGLITFLESPKAVADRMRAMQKSTDMELFFYINPLWKELPRILPKSHEVNLLILSACISSVFLFIYYARTEERDPDGWCDIETL